MTDGDKMLLSEVFVDDIIFGGNDDMCMSFADQMKKEFEMYLIGDKILYWFTDSTTGEWNIYLSD